MRLKYFYFKSIMFYFFATIILTTVNPGLTDGNLEYEPKPTPYQDWDYIVYSQRWPITECIDWMQRNPNHTCSLPEDIENWVVHGLWPTKTGKSGPWFCNSAIHFDPDQLQPMMKELQQHWPNIEGNTKPTSFWKHEWNKHGTCASVLPQLDSVTNYFNMGLQWNQAYKITNLLAKSKIVPNVQGYNLTEIYNVVKVAIGKNPIIQCVADGKTKQSLISEIQICFDKNLDLIHCNVTTVLKAGDVLGNCNRKNSVMYYNTIPNSTHLEEILNDYDYFADIDEPSLAEECLENFAYEKKLHKIYSVIKFLMWFTL